ncbi:MAG: KpsF/GutQ family sugar-phosphate isomerase [Planctomycetaceae bacterium]|jgi:arabinose-5-phosphate isomerase|nr:KpsF/GutQ family sugar-phosphate isomerase [Planctomycetaceae bacterium]
MQGSWGDRQNFLSCQNDADDFCCVDLKKIDAKTRLEKAREIIRCEGNAVLETAKLLDESFSDAVNLLLTCRGCVILSGIGKAGLIAQKLTATLSSTGTPSHFLHPAEAIHGDLGRVTPSDTAVIFSQSGETEEIARILPSLKKIGVPIIAVTATNDSTLARYATVVLAIGKRKEADPFNLAPTTSTTTMLALGDALALVTSAERGFQAENFAQFHPGGSLGRKLSRVEEYMRPLSDCRVAPDTETIREIFMRRCIHGRRSGAVLLQNGEGRLSGIFTDSDLARLFERRHNNQLDLPVSDVMTKTPIVIISGSRMLEAVAIMAKRKISELPVIDENRIPLGMLDVTDVVANFPEYAMFAEESAEKLTRQLRVVA